MFNKKGEKIKDKLLKELKNDIIKVINGMEFKPFLEDGSEELNDAYDNKIITYNDYSNIIDEIVEKIKD